MGLSKNKNEYQDYVIIIGCGRLGANLANSLSNNGGNVLIIDNNKDSFRKLSSSFGGLTLLGNATDIDVLHKAQIEKATAVVSVTNDDNTNIIVAQMVKEIFNIQHVITRLYDPERECVYREFEIETICPVVLSVKAITSFLDGTHKEEKK